MCAVQHSYRHPAALYMNTYLFFVYKSSKTLTNDTAMPKKIAVTTAVSRSRLLYTSFAGTPLHTC